MPLFRGHIEVGIRLTARFNKITCQDENTGQLTTASQRQSEQDGPSEHIVMQTKHVRKDVASLLVHLHSMTSANIGFHSKDYINP